MKEEMISDVADLFKCFSDPTRVKILCMLYDRELCVKDLASNVNVSFSAVSHQLFLLRNAKLVKNRRDGKIIYYTIADEHVKTILDMAQEHLLEKRN